MKGLVGAGVMCLLAVSADATVIWDISVGSGPPPSTLGAYAMTPFGDDTRGVFVSDVPSPLGGAISFDYPILQHVELSSPPFVISWSHGYRSQATR
jgi:hypothetical protein